MYLCGVKSVEIRVVIIQWGVANIIGKTKGALFAKRKVHKKFNYIATEADIKSVSASVTYTCLLSMFFRVQTLFKH